MCVIPTEALGGNPQPDDLCRALSDIVVCGEELAVACGLDATIRMLSLTGEPRRIIQNIPRGSQLCSAGGLLFVLEGFEKRQESEHTRHHALTVDDTDANRTMVHDYRYVVALTPDGAQRYVYRPPDKADADLCRSVTEDRVNKVEHVYGQMCAVDGQLLLHETTRLTCVHVGHHSSNRYVRNVDKLVALRIQRPSSL